MKKDISKTIRDTVKLSNVLLRSILETDVLFSETVWECYFYRKQSGTKPSCNRSDNIGGYLKKLG